MQQLNQGKCHHAAALHPTEGDDYNAPFPVEINNTTMDSVCYTISLMTDNMLEENETIHLQLSSAESFVSLTQNSAVITIIDSVRVLHW